ncbi:MAG: hypothetical protein JSS66_06970 [Armatimonadetes bacterium]|nr:hypothetical protein [Armatimonadota bacterium]
MKARTALYAATLASALGAAVYFNARPTNTFAPTVVASTVTVPYAPVSRPSYMPDPVKTPGDRLPVSVEQIARPGYARSVRNVSGSLKRKVYVSYGILSHKPNEYAIDHLISLQLGGSNDIKNLWPLAMHGPWNARIKKVLEDKLHDMVVKRQISLSQAQNEISINWVQAYQNYVGPGEASRYWND